MTRPALPPVRRVPAFVPVPLRARADGWTPLRQAEFIGHLAETRSVAAAAAKVGMARETAYRLRRRYGAEGFAAAWDAALGVTPRAWKVTDFDLPTAVREGTLRPVLREGRYVAVVRKPSISAILTLLARYDRALRTSDRDSRRPRKVTRTKSKSTVPAAAAEAPAGLFHCIAASIAPI
jgi:transposase